MEVRRYLLPIFPDLTIITLLDFHWPVKDVEEDKTTFQENAWKKARALRKQLRAMIAKRLLPELEGKLIIVVAEDSGLVVQALKNKHPVNVPEGALPDLSVEGKPGIASKRFWGLTTTEEDRNRFLLEALGGKPRRQRKAKYVCALVATTLDGRHHIATRGEWEGHLATAEKGDLGSGYDTLFVPLIPKGNFRHVAEMTLEEKNGWSHRGRAFKTFIEWLQHLLSHLN